jgi:hypothetical protein
MITLRASLAFGLGLLLCPHALATFALAWSLALGFPAHAQVTRTHAVEIRGHEPGYTFRLRSGEGEAMFHELCSDECTLALPAGRIRLEVIDEAGEETGSREINVNRAARWTVYPRDAAGWGLGLGLALGGLSLGIVGSALFASHAHLDFGVGHGTEPEGNADDDSLAGLGVFMLLTAAVITPIGIVLFFKNIRTRVRIEPLTTLRRGAAPGLALRGGLSF